MFPLWVGSVCMCVGVWLGGGAAPNEGHSGRPLLRPLMHPRPPGLAGRLDDWWGSRVHSSRVGVLRKLSPQSKGLYAT